MFNSFLCTETYLDCLFLIFKHIFLYTQFFLSIYTGIYAVGDGMRTSFLRHEQTNRKEQKMTKKSLMDFSLLLSLVIFYISSWINTRFCFPFLPLFKYDLRVQRCGCKISLIFLRKLLRKFIFLTMTLIGGIFE